MRKGYVTKTIHEYEALLNNNVLPNIINANKPLKSLVVKYLYTKLHEHKRQLDIKRVMFH